MKYLYNTCPWYIVNIQLVTFCLYADLPKVDWLVTESLIGYFVVKRGNFDSGHALGAETTKYFYMKIDLISPRRNRIVLLNNMAAVKILYTTRKALSV